MTFGGVYSLLADENKPMELKLSIVEKMTVDELLTVIRNFEESPQIVEKQYGEAVIRRVIAQLSENNIICVW